MFASIHINVFAYINKMCRDGYMLAMLLYLYVHTYGLVFTCTIYVSLKKALFHFIDILI